jgi:hypothetical protein
MLDRRHDLQLGQAQVPGTGSPESWTLVTEDVGDLDGRHALHPLVPSASIKTLSCSIGLATARIVRVATRA